MKLPPISRFIQNFPVPLKLSLVLSLGYVRLSWIWCLLELGNCSFGEEIWVGGLVARLIPGFVSMRRYLRLHYLLQINTRKMSVDVGGMRIAYRNDSFDVGGTYFRICGW